MSNGTRHKMYDFELTPPKGVWERIASTLDEADNGLDYPLRLQQMEVAPPAGLWNRISAQLERSSEVRPAKTPVRWLRYAAAAALLAAFAWGGSLLLNQGKQADTVTEKLEPTGQNTQPVTNQTLPPPDNNNPVATNEDDARNDAALEASKKTYAKLGPGSSRKIRNAANFHFALDKGEPVVADDLDPATRYIVLMTPDGNMIRMSKKWSDLVCCVSGEEQDAECVDQLKKWREKLANSSQTASPGNFGDILNLVKTLQE